MTTAVGDRIFCTCSACGHSIKAAPTLAGQERPCPQCKAPVLIPGAPAAAVDSQNQQNQANASNETQSTAEVSPLGIPKAAAILLSLLGALTALGSVLGLVGLLMSASAANKEISIDETRFALIFIGGLLMIGVGQCLGVLANIEKSVRQK